MVVVGSIAREGGSSRQLVQQYSVDCVWFHSTGHVQVAPALAYGHKLVMEEFTGPMTNPSFAAGPLVGGKNNSLSLD